MKPKVTKAVGNKTVSIVSPFDKGIYIFGNTFARGGEIIYDELQLKARRPSKKAIDSGVGYANISLEKLPEFAGDYIFTSPWSGSKVMAIKCIKAASGHHFLLSKQTRI